MGMKTHGRRKPVGFSANFFMICLSLCSRAANHAKYQSLTALFRICRACRQMRIESLGQSLSRPLFPQEKSCIRGAAGGVVKINICL